MNILVINAGSSSLKYQLFDMATRTTMARGQCERIGLDGRVKHCVDGRADFIVEWPMNSHAHAIRTVIQLLTGPSTGVVHSLDDIAAVGHRVVHGGEHFSGSVLITDEVIKAIEDCVPLAPLHNPPNLIGIRACAEIMAGVPQAAVFDTAFHLTMPPEAFMYALPYEYYERLHVRRYGFHGVSHRYVSARAADMLGKPFEDTRIISCHLGNGSSVTAVKGGKSIDTSMGFTPLEGLPMGTRSGSIDPAIPAFLAEKERLSLSEVTDLLNKRSGMLGLSGVSSDFRDLDNAVVNAEVVAAEVEPAAAAAVDADRRRAETALKIFAYSVKKYIGMYYATMGGADALVFTAGVGENNYSMRSRITEGLSCIGFELDAEKNGLPNKGERDLSTDTSRGRILMIPTNEELVIASDTQALLGNVGHME